MFVGVTYIHTYHAVPCMTQKQVSSTLHTTLHNSAPMSSCILIYVFIHIYKTTSYPERYLVTCIYTVDFQLFIICLIIKYGSMNYYPLFGVRSWNNGMCCMYFYILIYHHQILLFIDINTCNFTHCDQLMQPGTTARSQHWVKLWLVARKEQSITSTNV